MGTYRKLVGVRGKEIIPRCGQRGRGVPLWLMISSWMRALLSLACSHTDILYTSRRQDKERVRERDGGGWVYCSYRSRCVYTVRRRDRAVGPVPVGGVCKCCRFGRAFTWSLAGMRTKSYVSSRQSDIRPTLPGTPQRFWSRQARQGIRRRVIPCGYGCSVYVHTARM